MIGWLRLVLMIFYAPLRGLREARDRGSLLPIAVIAFLSQAAYTFTVKQFAGAGSVKFKIVSHPLESMALIA